MSGPLSAEAQKSMISCFEIAGTNKEGVCGKGLRPGSGESVPKAGGRGRAAGWDPGSVGALCPTEDKAQWETGVHQRRPTGPKPPLCSKLRTFLILVLPALYVSSCCMGHEKPQKEKEKEKKRKRKRKKETEEIKASETSSQVGSLWG